MTILEGPLAGGLPAPTPATLGRVSFVDLDGTGFEEFCFDLLLAMGFVNCDWRKGTPKKASPSDNGRDIEAYNRICDPDGYHRLETWNIDCKHYGRGVPPESFDSLITWSNATRPDVALIVVSGFLTNPAKNWIKEYVDKNRPPYRIRYWELPTLQRKIEAHPHLVEKHGLIVAPRRTKREIEKMHRECSDMLWYEDMRLASGLSSDDLILPPEVQQRMEAIEHQYDAERFGPWTEWETGYYNGVRSTLKWTLGGPWEAPKSLELGDE